MFAIDSLPFFIQPASLLYFDIHYHKLFEHYSLNVNNDYEYGCNFSLYNWVLLFHADSIYGLEP